MKRPRAGLTALLVLAITASAACADSGPSAQARGGTAASAGPRAKPQRPPRFRPSIRTLEASGAPVVYVLNRGCGAVGAWNAASGLVVWRPSAVADCEISGGADVTDVAAASDRLAWAVTEQANNHYVRIVAAAPVRGAKAKSVFDVIDDEDDFEVTDLDGRAGTLVFLTDDEQPGGTCCEEDVDVDGRAGVWLVKGHESERVASRETRLVHASVDGERIAVADVAGQVEILDLSGRSIRTFRFDEPTPKAIELTGDALVRLHAATIEAYDVESGAPLGRWDIASATAPLRLQDAYRGVVVYSSGPHVRFLRLADGKSASIKARSRVVAARLTDLGLVYATRPQRGKYRGRIFFVPTSALEARLA